MLVRLCHSEYMIKSTEHHQGSVFDLHSKTVSTMAAMLASATRENLKVLNLIHTNKVKTLCKLLLLCQFLNNFEVLRKHIFMY